MNKFMKILWGNEATCSKRDELSTGTDFTTGQIIAIILVLICAIISLIGGIKLSFIMLIPASIIAYYVVRFNK